MKNKRNHLNFQIYMLGIALIISLLFVSVGFSALSTTLTINGSAAFAPVGLIRVMSLKQDNLVGATEKSKGINDLSIKNTIDLDDINSYATYEVVIKNLGQVDYVLDHIDETVFSNEQVEYVLDGFQIGNIISAHEEKTFKIKFKYKDNVSENLVSRINSELKFVFNEYFDTSSFKLVFDHEGACTFNGASNITGYDCLEYQNKNYIDTGVSLYSTSNWQKDYEIGFTIDEYTHSGQLDQAVFVNTKYENASLKWPGLVMRRLNSGGLELTQSINKGNKVTKQILNYSLPLNVKIFRIDGVIYSSLNGGALERLQDMNNFNQQFDLTTWFGAAPDEQGVPMRMLKGTLSNMYIKMGKYTPREYTITFDPNGGSVTETSRRVAEYTAIGTLPTPTITNNTTFIGWYRDQYFTEKVDANTIFTESTTLYAKWSEAGAVAMNGAYYSSIDEALAIAPDNIETVISISMDMSGKITIPASKNIVFDFGEYTLSNSASTFTVENNGTLKIISGIITCNSATAAINNNETGTMIISGGEIHGTGSKQAVYNNGGNLTITGDALLTNTSNQRAAVHNLNGGTMTITGGTIISNSHAGVNNDKSTMTIGTNDGTINTTPIIQGKTYGITSTSNYKLYDGIVKGITNAVNDQAKITEIADNSQITTSTESIDNKTYKTLYLESTGE